MVAPGTPIVLKESIRKSHDTEQRRETAEKILEMWPEEKKKIAEAVDVSRTHVDNVLESHFDPLIPEGEPYAIHHNEIGQFLLDLQSDWNSDFTRGSNGPSPNIQPPESKSPEYTTGYMEGYLACWKQAQGIESNSD